ncbi:uncharacterized protein LOC134777199 [Penaeus indicus]|uniref:uncharacterized protein LOC134777199 n=1 Tax=Penaeus indicus TaxID=29960 RepID=UPI00300DACD6
MTQDENVVLGVSSVSEILLQQYPVPVKSLLLGIDVYVAVSYTDQPFVAVEVKRPICSFGKYCLHVRGCRTTCPYDYDLELFACPIPQALCVFGQSCTEGQGVDTCVAPEVLPTWTTIEGTAASQIVNVPGFQRISYTGGVQVLPGDVVSVNGTIGRRQLVRSTKPHPKPQTRPARNPGEGGDGDTVDSSPTGYHHYVAYLLEQDVVVKLGHACTTVNRDVTLLLSGPSNYPMSNTTSCERNITDVELSVTQPITDEFDATLNQESPYYVRTSDTAQLLVTFSVAGPIYVVFTFLPDIGSEMMNDTGDFPARDSGPYVLSHAVQFTQPDSYTATASASNKHNEDTGPLESTVTVVAQHPVVETWQMAPSDIAFLAPVHLPAVTFTEATEAPFPTDATVAVDWGDGSSPTSSPFTDPPSANHIYASGGTYTVNAFIYNMVSSVNVTCEVEIVEQIVDFTVAVKYLPYALATTLNEGTGKDANEYPIKRNLTFYPSMVMGTVDEFTLEHNGTVVAQFEVEDPLNPTLTTFDYYYDQEVEIIVTVRAINFFESVPFDFVMLIVGEVKGLKLDDYSVTTGKNETKTLLVTFESIGGSTCLVVSWGDATMTSYGDFFTCTSENMNITYETEPYLDVSMNVTHVYEEEGPYTITAMAFNPLSNVIVELLVIVTSIDCGPPKAQVIDGVEWHYNAPAFHRGYLASVSTAATLNCAVTSKTKKEWKIYHADKETGQITDEVVVKDILQSWNRSEIIIPARFLMYGLYKLYYTITMHDPDVLEDWMVFQKEIETYIEIIKTPLRPMIVEGGVSFFIRGPNQVILFEPAKYSLDLDFPEEKASGLLDYPGDSLVLFGKDFVALETTYEMSVTLAKDTREATVMTQVELLAFDPPIISISLTNSRLIDIVVQDSHTMCVDPALCIPSAVGVYINPSLRMGVVANCTDVCRNPLRYKWIVADHNNVPFPVTSAHFPVGDSEMELAFSDQFFTDNPHVTAIRLSVQVTDALSVVGGAAYFMQVNQKPSGGICLVSGPGTSRAVIDMFQLTCSGWADPEGAGVASYLITLIPAEGGPKTLTEMPHSSTMLPKKLVLPPGIFDFEVKVKDVWGAFTETVFQTGFEVTMPTKEEYDNANLTTVMDTLRGAGNGEMLIMMIAAQSALMAKAEWLSLDPVALANVSADAKAARMVEIASQVNSALDGIKDNVNLKNIESLDVTSSTIATIMNGASANEDAAKTVDLDARAKVLDISGNLINTLDSMDVSSPAELATVGNNLLTVLGGVAKGMQSLGDESVGCDVASPADMKKADLIDYDTGVTGIDMEIPEDVQEAQKCNVRDSSIKQAESEGPKVDEMISSLARNVLKKAVLGESLTLESSNGMVMKMDIVKGNQLTDEGLSVGKHGAKFTFPSGFCPQGNCSSPIATSAKEWPTLINTYTGGAKDLSPETRVLDLDLFDRNLGSLEVWDLVDPIRLVLTRNVGNGSSLPDFQYVNASQESQLQQTPIMYSTFNVTKSGLSVNLEITPTDPENHRLFVLVSAPKVPTLKDHIFFSMLEDIPKNEDTHDWFFTSKEINETGQYFVGIGEFKPDFNVSLMQDPWGNNVTNDALQNITIDYYLRVFTSGCYYFNKTLNDWVDDGLEVVFSNYNATECNTTHLTSFGSGMFVMPNTIDFSFVFANMGFSDNLTIYLTLILSLSIFVLLMIWARYKDKKDLSQLGATPLPDNSAKDKYLYEVLVFTGNKKEAQTDSTVQFILTGEREETDVRTFKDEQRKVFRKGAVDVFVMAVPRPLGDLEFLRIWHDNTGKGPNASWYLSYIVFRDVQTGKKYEFIANKWLAVESKDGQIDRLLPVAGKEQMTEFTHLFNTTKNKNLADGHLWFSVFLRPPRSRFTRCQRVASCFALLFLSMLVNAMWYDQVPEQPGTGGLQLGPFSLSPEQVLNRRRGDEQPDRVSSFCPHRLFLPEGEAEETQEVEGHGGGGEDAKRKKFTLPWWMSLVAWLLVVACIATSCFFLLMYGVMFGNSKATKWVTSLIVSFFSSILFIQPLKIFITAMIVSAVFKSVNLDEDDADEDEEDPELEDDEAWMHDGDRKKTKKKLEYKKADSRVLQELRERRRKEVEMYEILREIFAYMMFLWVLLILSYGNRDPNAYFLQQSLNQGFIHKGALDGSDYTKATNADRFWRYLHVGLLPDLRADRLYNGSPPYGLRGYLGDQCNRIMGYATIRQARIKKDSCRVNKKLRGIIKSCSGFSNVFKEENEAFCADWKPPTNLTKDTADCNIPEFSHTSGLDLNTLPTVGILDIYGAGGYVVHLNGSSKNLKKKLTFLQSKGWIDHLTRYVVVEFASYNAQVNLFGLSHIRAEFTPGGGVTPSFSFGLFIMVCEASFVAFIVYYTFREFRQLCRDKTEYFKCYWSYAEIAIIVTSYATIVVYIARHLATQSVVEVFNLTHGNGYVNLQHAASLDELYSYLVSFIVFVSTLKFIKLLRFNRRIGVLTATLRQCWDDLSGFLIAFIICFLSFTGMFYLLLNSQLENFHNFVISVETCFSMMLGKFQFEEMKQASSVVPVMFFIFVLSNSWVLINLLLTVIIRSFEQVKHDIKQQPSDYMMVSFVWSRIRGFLGMQGPPPPPSVSMATPLPASEAPPPCEEEEDVGERVEELPDKVDKFLEFVDDVYFNGTLDLHNKEFLKTYIGKPSTRSSSQSRGRSSWRRESEGYVPGPRTRNVIQDSLDDV